MLCSLFIICLFTAKYKKQGEHPLREVTQSFLSVVGFFTAIYKRLILNVYRQTQNHQREFDDIENVSKYIYQRKTLF